MTILFALRTLVLQDCCEVLLKTFPLAADNLLSMFINSRWTFRQLPLLFFPKQLANLTTREDFSISQVDRCVFDALGRDSGQISQDFDLVVITGRLDGLVVEIVVRIESLREPHNGVQS